MAALDGSEGGESGPGRIRSTGGAGEIRASRTLWLGSLRVRYNRQRPFLLQERNGLVVLFGLCRESELYDAVTLTHRRPDFLDSDAEKLLPLVHPIDAAVIEHPVQPVLESRCVLAVDDRVHVEVEWYGRIT